MEGRVMASATLINCFEVPAEREDEFLRLWTAANELLRNQRAYRTTRLHRALAPDARFRFINVAELDSVENWQSVLGTPEFGAIAAQMAAFSPTPGLYSVAVEQTVEPALDAAR
jgi:heme-degrading monooxygenase HmoA